MRRLIPWLVLAAACAAPPRSEYVPGGADLARDSRLEYRRAVRREQQGDLEGALEMLDELCARHPLRLGIHLRRLALARRVLGPEGAAAYYRPVPPGVDPERADILAGLALLAEEELTERKALLERAVAHEPLEALWRLALADVSLSAYDITVQRAEHADRLGDVQAAAGARAEARRVLEESRQEAETALQLDGNLKEAQLMLGYLSTRRADEADELEDRDNWRHAAEYHYRRALELDPACVASLLNLSENLLYFDRYGEAARLLRTAARLAPGEPKVWNNLGFTYYATGRIANAEACYGRALELRPHWARVRAALADAQRRAGDADAALESLRRARADAGDDRELKAAIAFKIAAIQEHEGRYREAIREYELHVRLDGRDAAKARSRIRAIYERAFEK